MKEIAKYKIYLNSSRGSLIGSFENSYAVPRCGMDSGNSSNILLEVISTCLQYFRWYWSITSKILWNSLCFFFEHIFCKFIGNFYINASSGVSPAISLIPLKILQFIGILQKISSVMLLEISSDCLLELDSKLSLWISLTIPSKICQANMFEFFSRISLKNFGKFSRIPLAFQITFENNFKNFFIYSFEESFSNSFRSAIVFEKLFKNVLDQLFWESLPKYLQHNLYGVLQKHFSEFLRKFPLKFRQIYWNLLPKFLWLFPY